MPPRIPTIHDVAREANASIATVSRALNGGVVSSGARARIEQAIAKLGYRRNDLARGLVTGRTGLVGVIVPDLVGPLYAQMARGIEDELELRGMHALIVTDHREAAAERRAVELLRARQVDGMVLIGSNLPEDELRAAAGPVPVALVQREGPDTNFPEVRIDDGAGVRAVVDHLVSLGHRRIGHLAGNRRDGAERREAFLAALHAAGLVPGPLVESDFSEEGGVAAAPQLLADPHVTAIFCANDRMAIGLLHAAAMAGRAVPDDLSVVGFDDLTWARFLTPALTTVRQPGRELGRAAARLVLEPQAGATASPQRRTPELIVRSSTARPPEATVAATRTRSAASTEEVIARPNASS